MASLQDPPKISSTTKNVVKAGGIMMFSLLLSRVLGLVRETVMVAEFGIGIDTDSFKLAFSVPDLIFMLIAGGGLSTAFIPVFSEFLHTNREEEAWKAFNVVTTISSIIAVVLIAVAWIIAPQVLIFMSEGKHNLNMEKTIFMSRVMLPTQFSFLVGSVVLGTLYARQRFVAPGLAPNIYNVGIIVGAFIGPIIGIGIVGMSWGALVGGTLGSLVLPLIVMIRLGGRYRPSLDIHAPGVKKFFILLLPVILGFSLPGVCSLITNKFASFYGEGINTVLSNSSNLMQAPLGIFGHSLALAAFPVLSQFFAQNRMDLYRKEVSRTIRTVIYLSAPASALLFALAPQIIDILYRHGTASHDAVSLHNLDNTAISLRVFAFGIIPWCIQPILMRGFFSLHKTLKPVVLGTAVTALFIVLCWANGHTTLGFLGLPWATNIAATVLAVILFVALEREVGTLEKAGMMSTLGKSLVGSAVMGGFSYLAFRWWHPQGLVLVLAFLFIITLAGWIYFFVTKSLNMPETDYLSRAMKRLDRDKRPIAEAEVHQD